MLPISRAPQRKEADAIIAGEGLPRGRAECIIACCQTREGYFFSDAEGCDGHLDEGCGFTAAIHRTRRENRCVASAHLLTGGKRDMSHICFADFHIPLRTDQQVHPQDRCDLWNERQ